ncbi:MAG TPA: ABC transporter substrate-binding protein [Acetobacteraceae bacterium]|jgi:phospholipid transport system substrate-binding protein|nr:ABC transporter substrate-binding protein [Acetobacteraceae bacterium]
MTATRRWLLGGIAAAGMRPNIVLGESLEWAAAFIRRSGEELTSIMANTETAEARRRLLQPFIDRVVDVDAVARFCLGRYWKQATPIEQQDYLRLFHAALTKAVLVRLGDYEHNEVRVDVERPEMRDGSVHVATMVERTGTPPARVTWVVNLDPNNPRIIDLIAEGVSLRITVRSDYNAFLVRHGNNIEALIDALRQQVA